MKKVQAEIILLIVISALHFSAHPSFGWFDETHLAVAKAAGYTKWYNATGADVARVKAGNTESYNHRFNNPEEVEVTPEMVLDQVRRYNDPGDRYGHLYGAIIASLRDYVKNEKEGKYPENHLAYCVHYVADLSQPLHNIPHDAFGRTHHLINDGIVEDEILRNVSRIKENMYLIALRRNSFDKDLAGEIARIANISRQLGYELKRENRDMTKDEAYVQLGHSASLLRGILKALGK